MIRTLIILSVLVTTVPARANRFDTEIDKALKADHVPGMALAVVKDGRVVKVAGYGVSSLEHRAKVTPSTRFEIASISKMFIATVVRMLADEGKLDLEDPVSKYFEHLPASWKAMRLRHLVGMSSGFVDDWDLIGWGDVRDEYDDKTMLDWFAKMKFESPIGERFHYSSPGYAMLGMIVAKVTGKPFAELVASRIFAPAGMVESTYNEPTAVIADRADGYRFDRDTATLKRGMYVAPYMHARADVGILATARDLARFAIALEAGKILDHVERLFVPFASDDGKRNLRYSYGWTVGLVHGHRVVSHTGGFRTGFGALFATFPDERVTIAITTNCSGCGHSYRDVILRTYVGESSPAREKLDRDASARMLDGLRAFGGGKVDDKTFAPDALGGVEDLEPALAKATALTVVSRHDLRDRKLRWEEHELADYVTVHVEVAKGGFDLELYRDPTGIVQDVELSP